MVFWVSCGGLGCRKGRWERGQRLVGYETEQGLFLAVELKRAHCSLGAVSRGSSAVMLTQGLTGGPSGVLGG